MSHSGAPDLADWLRLTLLPGVGGATQRALLKECGLPGKIFSATQATLSALVGERLAGGLRAKPEHEIQAAIDAALAWADLPGNAVLTLMDAAYPKSLLATSDPPSVIYAKGRLDLLQRPALAIVGSRNATAGGLKSAERFAHSLAASGYTIVSGLAVGIDAAAHAGALTADGSTIAVIGTGADRVYPARHQALARQIAEKGLILSEFPLGCAPSAANFPRRNRIISGLSLGVLVVEASLESGSLITARLAGDQGREVFAIPGSIHSPQAKGCHQLIKQGAKLVESVDDVLDELGTPRQSLHALAEADGDSAQQPSGGHELLAKLEDVGHDPFSVDELAARTMLTTDTLLAMLLELELAGYLCSLPGGRYQRVS